MDRPLCLRNRGIGPVPRDCSAAMVCCRLRRLASLLRHGVDGVRTATHGCWRTQLASPQLAPCCCLPVSLAAGLVLLPSGVGRGTPISPSAASHRFGQSSQAGQAQGGVPGDLALVCGCGWVGAQRAHGVRGVWCAPPELQPPISGQPSLRSCNHQFGLMIRSET